MTVLLLLGAGAAFSALCIKLAVSQGDRAGFALTVGITVAAGIFAAGIIRVDDVIEASDCVGVCISSFEYDSAWFMALGGGLVLLIAGAIAITRAALIRRRRQTRETGAPSAAP